MINFNKLKKFFAPIPFIVIIAGIIGFCINGFNYGIDFSGGTIMRINAGQFIEEEKVYDIVKKVDSGASVVYAGANKETVVIKSTLALTNEQKNQISRAFVDEYKVDRNNIEDTTTGPSISREIRQKAVISIIIASILMLIYVTFRFEWKYGVASVFALIVDVLVIVATYGIFNLQIDSSLIAATLTIVGYSINATIVIFDRFRENKRMYPRMENAELIETSLNSTFRRTVLTTITTLIAVVVLYITGGHVIEALCIPLLVGIVEGMISSTFIAPYTWGLLEKNFGHGAKSKRA
ncbi:MAG: protein translocase subunit SecF [Eubacteriales bacterium]|uniref:protein translocase subunit SecF n=2 Tax=Fenollaria TaxID=1686313 RepID=UPI002A75E30D|nr:protein translocase subunit SecF [Fenollaria sp.]MDD7339912.1 protein translocase subunit SecF [Eubacteriales bacterium]MDY3105649.1 protein translocase subunit SecF [Fenollaria sp.]